MKHWLLPVLVTLCLPSAVYGLETKGLSQDHLKLLKREVPSVFSQQPGLQNLDSAIKTLFLTEDFETLRVLQKTDGSFTLVGIPVKRIKEIIISGNRAISDSDAKALLRIAAEERFDRQQVVDGVNAIKERYGLMGYLNTRLEASFEDTPEGHLRIKLSIDEGVLCRLNKISFVTNNQDLAKNLNRIAKRYLKKPVEQDTVNNLIQDIQTYFADHRYLIAGLVGPEVVFNSEKTSSEVTFQVERPYQFILYFEGNATFPTGEILRSIAVNATNPTGANPAAELSERIKEFYLTRGFANVDIKFTEKVFGDSFSRRVQFDIKEGPKVKIGSLKIEGNTSKSKDWYLSFLDDHSSSIHKLGTYNRKDLDASLESLLFELQNEGFLKAKIKSTRVEFNKRRDQVAVEVLVEEGPQTLISEVAFDGATTFSIYQLRDVVNLQAQMPLSLKKIEESIKVLQDHYHSQGYIDMAVTNPTGDLVSYSEDNTRAKILYRVSEGPKVKVGSITIEGNEKTHESVIYRELEFQNGDTLTPELINDSLYRLQRIALFSEVSITTLEKGTPIADRTVVVKVTERNPGLFTSGIGVNTEFDLTLRGYLGVGYRNLQGRARGLTGRIELKRVTDIDFMDHRITAGYLEPHLFRSRTRGLVNLTRSYSIQQRDRGRGLVIAADSNELELLLEREFFRHLKVTWNLWSIASIIEFEIDDKQASESTVIAAIGPTVELDLRDNPFNPTEGFFARVNSEYSDPALGSSRSIQYTRTNGAISHYIPLGSPRWVWANSVRGGFIKNLNPNGGIPNSKLFLLGGRSTIRGFDTGVIPPRDSLEPIKTESHFYLLKTEFRFPISGDLGAVAFYDGGAVKILCDRSRPDVSCTEPQPEYRDAVGLGIRYNTPVGPVSAEYGFKLRRIKDLNESEGRFHFSIGTF